MTTITVKSEHKNDVLICDDWLSALTSSLNEYSRVAVFYAESQKNSIPKLSINSDVQGFRHVDQESHEGFQDALLLDSGD